MKGFIILSSIQSLDRIIRLSVKYVQDHSQLPDMDRQPGRTMITEHRTTQKWEKNTKLINNWNHSCVSSVFLREWPLQAHNQKHIKTGPMSAERLALALPPQLIRLANNHLRTQMLGGFGFFFPTSKVGLCLSIVYLKKKISNQQSKNVYVIRDREM